MSSATRWPSNPTDHVLREVVDAAVANDGLKRGLHRAAEMLGVTERWLRAFRYGEPARVSAETYLRALEARRILRDERRSRLLAELHAIEAAAHADRLDPTVRHPVLGERPTVDRRRVGG